MAVPERTAQNVQPLKQYTKGEQAFFDRWEAQRATLMANGSADAREAAIGGLKLYGLPTRRVESWHYTDLRAKLLELDFPEASNDAPPVQPLVQIDQAASATGFNASKFSPDRVELSFQGSDDTIGQLNAAFADDGLNCTIDAGASFDVPLEFATIVNGGQKHRRHTIAVEEGANVTFVERQVGAGGLGTCVTHLEVGPKADVTYVVVQQTSVASTHLAQINATISEDAKLTVFVLNAGGSLVRQEVRVRVEGENADFQLRGVNLIGEGQHIDVTMDLKHLVPNTTSEEIIRNIVAGKGHGVFQGRIAVDRIAQKTDAKMACNTLLLTDDGDFSTKPELEIFADDVACGHGATFTDLEPSHMFYLMSRGIPEREAQALLVKGFVDEIVDDLDDERLSDALVDIIDGWLDKNA
ncbi:MAG: Fe-S cluster assembly protein SufD [Pseudomonadota bacterium]